MNLDRSSLEKLLLSVLFLLITSVLLVGCRGESQAPNADTAPETTEAAPEETVAEKAQRLAHDMLIIDTHVDLPYRLQEEMEDVSQRTEKGDFDFVRAKEGGLDAPFMSIYVPADYQETGGAKDFADSLIDMVAQLETDYPDKFRRGAQH